MTTLIQVYVCSEPPHPGGIKIPCGTAHMAYKDALLLRIVLDRVEVFEIYVKSNWK